jgi:hypothetical protein
MLGNFGRFSPDEDGSSRGPTGPTGPNGPTGAPGGV